ncbi:MAG: WSD1 family O-acyltransferase, partial [Pseudomonadota bacterium]
GNQVAAMIAPLGSHLADPGERLAYVFSQTKNSKALTNAIGARTMTEVSKVNPLLYMALGAQLFNRVSLAHRLAMPFNTVVTNVPGPPVPIYCAGARMESMALALICLTDGLGLAHIVQSYVDEATISFTACRDIMPDPEFYSQCLQESFDDMLAAAQAASTTGTSGTSGAIKMAPVKAPAKRAAKAAPKKAPAKASAKTASKTRSQPTTKSTASKTNATKPSNTANTSRGKASSTVTKSTTKSASAGSSAKRKPARASAARIAKESK